MKAKSIFMLVLVLVAGVAYLKSREAAPSSVVSTTLKPGEPLFGDLDLNKAARVEIQKAGEEQVVLLKGEAGWIVDSRFGYAADFVQLSQGLQRLSELKVGQVVVNGESFLEELGLSETTTVQIVLRDVSGDVLADLKVGGARTSSPAQGAGRAYSSEHYVRKDNGAPILLNTRFDMNYSSDAWLYKELIDLQGSNFVRIKVTHEDESYLLEQTAKGDHVLVGLEDSENPDAANLLRVANALSNLRLNSLANPISDESSYGLDMPSVYVATTSDGKQYKVKVGSKGDRGRFVKFDFSYARPPEPTRADALLIVLDDEKAAETILNQEDREAKVDEKLAELQEEILAAEATANAAFAERAHLKDWVYILTDYQASAFATPRKDLILDPRGDDAGTAINSMPAAGGPTGFPSPLLPTSP